MSDHELRELSTQLVRGSIDERCAILSALSGLAELAQSEQGLGSVVQALKELLTQLSARPHLDEAEIDMLSQALRLLDQVTKTDEDGGYSHAFCGPTVLCLIRDSLSQLARDVDTLAVTLSVLRRLGGQYPLSMLRSQILHDLLRDERLWGATGSPGMRQSLLAVIVASAHRMQSREDAALLLMLVPSLTRIANIPPLASLLLPAESGRRCTAASAAAALGTSGSIRTPSAQTRQRSGSRDADDASSIGSSLLLAPAAAGRDSTPGRTSSGRHDSAGASVSGAGSRASATTAAATEPLPELFVRELALRALCVTMTRLIDFSNVPPCPSDAARRLERQRHREARRAAAAAALSAASSKYSSSSADFESATAAPALKSTVDDSLSIAASAGESALEASTAADNSATVAKVAEVASSLDGTKPEVACAPKPTLSLEGPAPSDSRASSADAAPASVGAACTSVSLGDLRVPAAFGADAGSNAVEAATSASAPAGTEAAPAAESGAIAASISVAPSALAPEATLVGGGDGIAESASPGKGVAADISAPGTSGADTSAVAATSASAASTAAAAAAASSSRNSATHTMDREVEADAAAAISLGLHGRGASRRGHHPGSHTTPAPGESGGPPASEAWKSKREAGGSGSDWPRRGAAHLLNVHRLQRLLAAVVIAATTLVPVPDAPASIAASPAPAPAAHSSSLSSSSLRLQSTRRFDGRREGAQQLQQALLPLSLPTLRILLRSLTAAVAFWRFQSSLPALLTASRPIEGTGKQQRRGAPSAAAVVVATSESIGRAAVAASDGAPAALAAAEGEGGELKEAAEQGPRSSSESSSRSRSQSRAGKSAKAHGTEGKGEAELPFPEGFLTPAEAHGLHAAVLRLLAAAPLALPSLASPEERGEALELADDACVLLLDTAREADSAAHTS